jgi:F0F1-type ATP synthase assembly protein I
MTGVPGKGSNIGSTVLIVMIGQVGCVTLLTIMAAVLGGVWLDEQLGTGPIITLVLLVAGIPLSVLMMITLARRTVNKIRANAESASDPHHPA